MVRLNKRCYDRKEFTSRGIGHHDLIFPDGSAPPVTVWRQFLDICDATLPTDAAVPAMMLAPEPEDGRAGTAVAGNVRGAVRQIVRQRRSLRCTRYDEHSVYWCRVLVLVLVVPGAGGASGACTGAGTGAGAFCLTSPCWHVLRV